MVARMVRTGTGWRDAGAGTLMRGRAYRRGSVPAAMGQPITVIEKPSATAGVVRFEANRSLTGMGHERYPSREEAVGIRPPDELARRLFDTGRVDGIHIYSNVITVDLKKGCTADGMRELVEELFIYYRPGVTPATP